MRKRIGGVTTEITGEARWVTCMINPDSCERDTLFHMAVRGLLTGKFSVTINYPKMYSDRNEYRRGTASVRRPFPNTQRRNPNRGWRGRVPGQGFGK